MANASSVIHVLQRELKARGLTYAEVARRIGMSEASIKRMFSERSFTLERLDQILAAAGIEFSELTREFDREQHLLAQLTDAQEREIIADPRLFLVAFCALNQLSFDDILAAYRLTPAELVGLLARLDRIGIVELLPNNRYKLRVARTFAWLPNGPIQSAFKAAADDFFDSSFAADDELMTLMNGRLSRAGAATLIDRLKRVAREFADRHNEDAGLPADARPPMSLLLACRPWQPQFVRELSKPKPATPASRKVRR